jgi:hypothetical protein
MMTTAARAHGYAFTRGEEVVARLAGVRPYHLQGGGPLSPACIPSWTIGSIVAAGRRRRRAAYLLRFRHDDGDCMCWIDESAIDGVC